MLRLEDFHKVWEKDARWEWSILDAHVQCKEEHDNKIYWEESEKRDAENKASWPPEFW